MVLLRNDKLDNLKWHCEGQEKSRKTDVFLLLDMQRFIFQLLHQSLNISQQHGCHSSLIYMFWFVCSPMDCGCVWRMSIVNEYLVSFNSEYVKKYLTSSAKCGDFTSFIHCITNFDCWFCKFLAVTWGYFRLELSPTSGRCPRLIIFFKILLSQNICRGYEHSEGQLRVPFLTFYNEKVPFLYLPDAAFSF